MKKYPIIRTLYLYIFTAVGLVLIITASVDFIDMGLKAYVFTRADEDPYETEYRKPIPADLKEDTIEEAKDKEQVCFSGTNKEEIESWVEDRKATEASYDPVLTRRHRDASRNLAMILIGLPLYLFHWTQIKKDIKKKKED